MPKATILTEDQKIIETYILSFEVISTAVAPDWTTTSPIPLRNPFLVRTAIVKSITMYFEAPNTSYLQPDTPLLIFSDIFGSDRVIGQGQHDDTTYSHITKRTNPASLMNINGSYNFRITSLTGANPTFTTGKTLARALVTITIELRSY